ARLRRRLPAARPKNRQAVFVAHAFGTVRRKRQPCAASHGRVHHHLSDLVRFCTTNGGAPTKGPVMPNTATRTTPPILWRILPAGRRRAPIRRQCDGCDRTRKPRH